MKEKILELIKEYEAERKIHLKEIPKEFFEEDAPENTEVGMDMGAENIYLKVIGDLKYLLEEI